MRPSQNLPISPRIHLPFQHLHATLPESTPPSQNIPHFKHLRATFPRSTPPSQNISTFSTTIWDPPRIYPSLPEYTPSLLSYYMRPSQNLPLPPRIYPYFQQLYATLPESTLPPKNVPPPFLVTICDPPRI